MAIFNGTPEAALQVRLVDDALQLSALEPAWCELIAASGAPEFMVQPSWALTFLRNFGEGRTPAIALFCLDDKIVGLAPMCRRRHTYAPGLHFQRLELISSDFSDPDGVCGEYVGLIARKGFETSVADAFARALQRGALGPWDECVMNMMSRDTPVSVALRKALAEVHGIVEEATVAECIYLPLPATWEIYLAGLSKKRRAWIRRTMTDFTSWAGDDGYSIERAHDAHSLQRGIGVLHQLHAERWRIEGQSGAFASPRFRNFHLELCEKLVGTGALELTWLVARGRPVAANYSFLANGKVYFYQSGRTTSLPNHIGAGNVITILSIQDAIARGLREYDFMSGSPWYKSMFTSQSRQLVRMRVVRPCVREKTHRAMRWAMRTARRLSGKGYSAEAAGGETVAAPARSIARS